MGAARYAGFGIGFIAAVGILFTTAFREWKRNSVQSSQANFMQVYSCEGLWVRCTSPVVGQFQCDDYDSSLIGLPPQLQGMRAMMCLATVFMFISMLSSVISLPCTAALQENQKVTCARVAGVLAFLAGALCVAAVSWYAADVIYQFWSFPTVQQSFKYEFGSALYVGWISSGLALISGILLACCTCGATDDTEEYRYNYKPPVNKPAGRNTEYV